MSKRRRNNGKEEMASSGEKGGGGPQQTPQEVGREGRVWTRGGRGSYLGQQQEEGVLPTASPTHASLHKNLPAISRIVQSTEGFALTARWFTAQEVPRLHVHNVVTVVNFRGKDSGLLEDFLDCGDLAAIALNAGTFCFSRHRVK